MTCTHQQLAPVDEGERQVAHIMHQMTVPTPGTVEDHMRMLENELAECRYTIVTLMCELEAFRVNLQRAPQVQHNSTQTHQVDMDATVSSSDVVKTQHANVQSPHSEAKSREAMPTRRGSPVVMQGLELLSTESSDNGREDGQGDVPNIMGATAVAGEADPIIAVEGGISMEGLQMMGEHSGECPTDGGSGTRISVSVGQVGAVICAIAEEELGATGGKFVEEH
ncbi:hypothetical protein EDC04DRAFT_2909800 [Pisolithus marmoratus]|nr:hypothetical protein EDC04DRAFT_2909800 [Pisolithus marmoratus]